MPKIEVGQIVRSKAGKDKGSLYFVWRVGEGFADVLDGKKRKINRPKVKRFKHLVVTDRLDEETLAHILAGREDGSTDYRIRRILLAYRNSGTEESIGI